MTAALEGGEWSEARPGRTLPAGKTLYPLCRRLGGPQGRSGRAENEIKVLWASSVPDFLVENGRITYYALKCTVASTTTTVTKLTNFQRRCVQFYGTDWTPVGQVVYKVMLEMCGGV